MAQLITPIELDDLFRASRSVRVLDVRFCSPGELGALFAGAGVRSGVTAAAYFGSGVTAAQAVFAAELAGLGLQLYPGSWSQWWNTPGRPVATGHAPADVTGTV